MAGEFEDFYAILGVSPNATLEEIKQGYYKALKANHPDKHTMMKSDYQAACEKSGVPEDEEILRKYDKNIHEAEQRAKAINNAYETLSDSDKRAVYDLLRDTQSIAPRIVISVTELDFGTLVRGKQRTLTFTVDNLGGRIQTGFDIAWERQPEWADFITHFDSQYGFPVTVRVDVQTTGIKPRHYTANIKVVADRDVQTVTIRLIVKAPIPKHKRMEMVQQRPQPKEHADVHSATFHPASPPPVQRKTFSTTRIVSGILIIGIAVLIGLVILLMSRLEETRLVAENETAVALARTRAVTATPLPPPTQTPLPTRTPLPPEPILIESGDHYKIEQIQTGYTWFELIINAPEGFVGETTGLYLHTAVKDLAGNWQPDEFIGSEYYSSTTVLSRLGSLNYNNFNELPTTTYILHQGMLGIAGKWGNTRVNIGYGYYNPGFVFPISNGFTTRITLEMAKLEVGVLNSNGSEALAGMSVNLYCQSRDIAGNRISDSNCADHYSERTDARGIATFYAVPGEYFVNAYQLWLDEGKLVYDIELSAGEEKQVLVNYP